jgi:hypothetical protein
MTEMKVVFIQNPKWVLLGWYKDSPQVIFDAVSREYDATKERLFGDTDIVAMGDFEEILREMFKLYPIADQRTNKTRENYSNMLEDKWTEWRISRGS